MSFRSHKILRTMLLAHRKSRHVRSRSGQRIENISLAEAVPEIQHISRRQIVVQPQSELIVVRGFTLRGNEVVCAIVRLRIERQQILRNRIDERKLVERNRLSGKFVDELVGRLVLSVPILTDAVAVES